MTGVAGSNSYYPLLLKNVSQVTCTLYGYPGVSVVTGLHGSQIGGQAVRNPGLQPGLVTLSPGAAAWATLQIADVSSYPQGQCRPAKANYLRVYPPGQFVALFVRFQVETCTGKITGSSSTLGIYPVQPSGSQS